MDGLAHLARSIHHLQGSLVGKLNFLPCAVGHDLQVATRLAIHLRLALALPSGDGALQHALCKEQRGITPRALLLARDQLLLLQPQLVKLMGLGGLGERLLQLSIAAVHTLARLQKRTAAAGGAGDLLVETGQGIAFLHARRGKRLTPARLAIGDGILHRTGTRHQGSAALVEQFPFAARFMRFIQKRPCAA